MEDNHNQSKTFTPNLLIVSSDHFDFWGGGGGEFIIILCLITLKGEIKKNQ